METADDPACPVKREIVSVESKRDWRLFNIVLLGIAFMLMFTAFQTCGMVEVGRLSTGVAHNGTEKPEWLRSFQYRTRLVLGYY